MKLNFFFGLVAVWIGVTGCAQYAQVSTRRPHFRPVKSTVEALRAAESRLAEAMRVENRDPRRALGEFLLAAQIATEQLSKNPDDASARASYNFAVARIVGSIQRAKLDPWSRPVEINTSTGPFVLWHRRDPRPQWNPNLYDFTPADQFDVKGTYVTERSVKEGLGAPTVAIGKQTNERAGKDFMMPRTYYGVTAIVRFQGRRAEIAFEDPLSDETVKIAGRTFPLAADFTVPLAVLLDQANPKKLEISRLLWPEKYAETARITRLQPYDPNKTVVLVIHGLMDTPATWTPMLNRLRTDETIRRHYQFWFYSYPSGYPYPYSAAILRRELDAVERRFPLKKKMVLIGHSMGGCISRLMITDTGDKLWRDVFGKSPAETSLTPGSRELLTESLIFRHRPEVGRVIFIAAPLKGADMARTWVGRFGSMVVRTPASLLGAGADALKVVTFHGDDLRLRRIPNSIDTLAPNNRLVRAINRLPLAPGIPYYVISGDRGRGGNRDAQLPVMSDGVVPYWSSHMEGARSELVVPSDHNAHKNPQTMAEVRRILVEAAGD
jgi:pimeloyl-ACP methyl ester carboxylesterase